MKEQKSAENKSGLSPYLSSIAVWALSVGSAIGWGSLVVTSSSYLSQAGPLQGTPPGVKSFCLRAAGLSFFFTKRPEKVKIFA